MRRVAICVATHRRPLGLMRLVRGLEALTFTHSEQLGVGIVIVDNDPARSAAAICDSLAATCRWPIRYLAEPRRGIAFARNAGVHVAREQRAELIAFIDDDEVPEPVWLDELVLVMAEYQAAVVTGPVLPMFEVEAPAWIRRGRFFDRPRHATGTHLDRAYAGNVLVQTRALDALPTPFDERRALRGGEDTHLFFRLADTGHRIVWADRAVVNEWNPATRLSANWLMRRAFSSSANWSSFERELRPSLRLRAAQIVKAIGRIGQGMILLPIGLVAGRRVLVQALQRLSMGAGSLAGMVGWELDEYRVTHGS